MEPGGGSIVIAVALAAIVGAMLLVRLGWQGRRGVAAAGWTLAAVALAALVWRDGAWGLAVGTVAGIAVALALVLRAGWSSPGKSRRPAREPASVTLPHRPGEIARRFAVFLLTVPLAFAAALWLAFGAQALARRHGMGEADTLVLTLFLQPVLWTILMAWQMTRSGPARMIAPAVGAAAIGTILWGAA